MTVTEAAKELGVSPHLVYKLCDGGKLRHRRIGFGRGTIRVSREDLDEYLAACEVAPAGGTAEPKPRRVKGLTIPEYVPSRRRT